LALAALGRVIRLLLLLLLRAAKAWQAEQG
jgi:hypothetical protein